MKRGIWAVVLLVSVGVNAGFLLHWFWPKTNVARPVPSPHAQAGWHASSMRRCLGLNARQVQLMDNERLQVMAQAKPLQEELRLKRRQLFLLLKKKTVAEAELDSVLGELSRLQTAIEKMFILHSLHVKEFFNERQRQTYDGFFEQGLCPGMVSEKNCPPGGMAGSGPAAGDCEKTCDLKK